MAAYCAAADVKAYLGTIKWEQLTADADPVQGDTGPYIGDTNIDSACEKQSRLMDGYLMGRYTTPITGPANVMDVLKVHCIRLTIYSLFQARLMAEEYQTFQMDRDITIKWLEAVANGKASIPGQSQPNVTLPTSAAPIGGSMTQIFGTEEPLF